MALSKYTQSALQLPSSKISQNSRELREKGAQQAYRNYSSPVTSLISESAKAPFRFYTEICLHGSKTLKFLL